ncbi:hypothetical protein TrLO_g9756 [Triparma laevis f. longispina]|uniref:Uncharacterized protein n=1 Tax=Triparma laevis f. longispina TaxID=1714387 RepID=A0A9W7EDH9_9STRA|nr:hypothetical protein TrLO_g9756 [Triparma laevis f. longispina]
MDKFKKWDIVGLVFIKNGEVVTGSQYVDFKSGQSVEGWLEGVGGDKNMNGNVERLCFQEEEEEEEDDTEYYDCGLEGCKKEFYHQHIAPGGAQVVNGLEDLRV